MTRRQLFYGGALVVLAILAGGGYVVRNRLAAAHADAVKADGLLAKAREVVARAEREKLVTYAEASFAAVTKRIGQGTKLLTAGQGREAALEAEAAFKAAEAAYAEAKERMPVARTALLRAIHNKVLYKPAAGVAWTAAETEMSLYDKDRISTKEKSEAIVRFNLGNELRVEENSVMVVEQMLESKQGSSLSMTLSVPEGGIRTAIARDHDKDVRIEINLPKAGIVLDTAKMASGKAEVGTRVHPDKSNRIAVYTGEAEVTAPSGEKVVVKENQYAEVSADGALSAVKELPTSGIILLPGRNATVYISSNRPEVTFKWKATGTCAKFHLQVATDPEFLAKIVDERIARTSFTYGNLKPGKYVWRMTCADDRGNEGAWSEVSTFEVVIDNEAPRLAVVSPAANFVTSAAMVEARCRTEAGVAVFINGIEAPSVSNGEYAKEVPLVPGINTLVFEAVDAAGNVIYNSLLVTRR